MGRFNVVTAPTQQPGVDYVTGSGVGPFIDTGRDITFGERKLGRIYLSKDTIAEMAREFDLVGNSHATEEALQSAYVTGKLDGLRETFGGDITRVVDVLERWLDLLRPALAAAEAAEAGQVAA